MKPYHPRQRCLEHDDYIKWKHFPRNWPFVWGIHRSPVNSLHKGQLCGALMFSLICAWINSWINNHEVGDLRRHRAHYDVSVMRTRINDGLLPLATFQRRESMVSVHSNVDWHTFASAHVKCVQCILLYMNALLNNMDFLQLIFEWHTTFYSISHEICTWFVISEELLMKLIHKCARRFNPYT